MKHKIELLDMNKLLILVLVAVFSYWGLNNLKVIFDIFKIILRVLSPFLLGVVIAFVLNIPMSKIESYLKSKIKNKDSQIRVVSIVLSLLIFIGVIAFVSLLLIPELIESTKMLINNIPVIIEKVENFVLDLLDKYPDIQVQIKELFSEKGNVNDVVTNILNYCINGAIEFISGLISGIIVLFTAIVFSVYMLSQKEYLIRAMKKVLYAFLNRKDADKVLEIGSMANTTFSKFVSGQCMEAAILGVIMFIAFTIFRFPYALIIAVLTAITALIPIFGALIAMAIGTILIAITNPIQAIIFIIVFQVVQQIEGNFIYPRVVGKSVGLSPMWTLLSITVGGNLFGIVGMLVGLPLASILYAIITGLINNKLKEKEMKI